MMSSQPLGDRFEVTELTVAAAQRGDHEAIGALGSDAFRRTVAFYRYTGLSPDHAEDLAADAVEHIISKLPTLRKASAYDAWMWTIARNLLRSFWRSRKTRDVREPLTPAPPTPEEQAIIHEDHAQIVRALGSLTLKDRELLWLREILELDYGSIAQRIESNTGAVRVACHRARKRLQAAYESADRGNIC